MIEELPDYIVECLDEFISHYGTLEEVVEHNDDIYYLSLIHIWSEEFMRLSNGFVIDKEKTFGELKFTAVRDVFLQNEDGTPSTQLKKRIYDLKCSLHGGIIPVSVPPEVPLREFPYNAVVELVNPVADTVSRKTYTGADVDWYVKAEDIVLKNKGNQNAGSPQNHTPQGQPKK